MVVSKSNGDYLDLDQSLYLKIMCHVILPRLYFKQAKRACLPPSWGVARRVGDEWVGVHIHIYKLITPRQALDRFLLTSWSIDHLLQKSKILVHLCTLCGGGQLRSRRIQGS